MLFAVQLHTRYHRSHSLLRVFPLLRRRAMLLALRRWRDAVHYGIHADVMEDNRMLGERLSEMQREREVR